MHILISGGWGYGNLGDDAILVSTTKLLRARFPHCKITILSYNPAETQKLFPADSIEVFPSADRLLYAGKMDIGKTDSLTFWQKKRNRFVQKKEIHLDRFLPHTHLRIVRREIERGKQIISASHKDFLLLFKQCDLFLLSGGGYLNDWLHMSISKSVECETAAACHKKILTIGVTVDACKYYCSKKLITALLEKSAAIYVRDRESRDEYRSLLPTIKDEIIPDLALYETKSYEKEKGLLTIIPFNSIKHLSGMYVNVLKERKEVEKVIITVSQTWDRPLRNARELYGILTEAGIATELIIPSSFQELEDTLGRSSLVLSQNLHGLILAYRNKTPIICLNGSRKFKAFMEITGEKENFLPPSLLTEEKLSAAISAGIQKGELENAVLLSNFSAKLTHVFQTINSPV